MEHIKEAIQQQELSRGKMAFEFRDSTVAMRPCPLNLIESAAFCSDIPTVRGNISRGVV